MDANWNPTERERLEQELLELHFGCHPDPAALEARLQKEPALVALQQQVLATAKLLQTAAVPEQTPLRLDAATRSKRRSSWTPLRRLSVAAAAAVVFVAVPGGLQLAKHWRLDSAKKAQCQVTLSGPRAVVAGAPWSFTIEATDYDGTPKAATVRWRAIDGKGAECARGDTQVIGRSSTSIAASLAPPQRLEVEVEHAGGRLTQQLQFETAAAPPMLHVATDKPVYRPGEVVRVRAVSLDRCTLAPVAIGGSQLSFRDSKGAVVHAEAAMGGAGELAAVATGAWQVPAESAGGEHTVELDNGTGLVERATFVVRPFENPRLQKVIALDRTTYSPGEHGRADVTIRRLGGGAAVGAAVHGSLVLDGLEVWSADGVLDGGGRAQFAFTVPTQVARGAARFVARITDGGIVETELKPFVVPTGEVFAHAYPEGGDLVADVENRIYVEFRDGLDRPLDCSGVIETDRGEPVAEFTTAHQGRARIAFVPENGRSYRLRGLGMKAPLALPAVKDRGIALRAVGDRVAAGEPVRLRLAGRLDGPCVLGVFCRGVLVGQATVAASANGAIDTEVAIDVPASVAGVLRATVFDRTLQPVAERLVQRDSSQRLAIAIDRAADVLAPGASQSLTVRVNDERGAPVVGAAVGLAVTDGSVLALATEPRVGLLDQLLLFADCERIEELGSVLVGAADSPRNVDLMLGTRGWRRFVWRNDDTAKQSLAKAGPWGCQQLQREGFSQQPQAVGNGDSVETAVAPFFESVRRSESWLGGGAALAILLLLTALLVEGLAWLLREGRGRPWVLLGGAGLVTAGLALVALFLVPQIRGERPAEMDQLALNMDFVHLEVPGALKFAAAKPADARNLLMFGGGDRGPVVMDLAEIGQGTGAEVREEENIVLQPGFVGREPPAGFDVFHVGEDRRPMSVGREYAHAHLAGSARRDFTATICWQPLLVTDAKGTATVRFDTSDAVTTWHALVDAHGSGRVGQAEAEFATRLPFRVEAALPVEASAGDRLSIQVAFECIDPNVRSAALELELGGLLQLEGQRRREVALVGGRARESVTVVVTADAGQGSLAFTAQAGRFRDEVRRTLAVVPRGFPHERSLGGKIAVGTPARLPISIPAAALPGSGRLVLRVFPSPLAGIAQGLQGILQQPCGCFEQASSSNYPNVMVLGYLQASGDDIPAISSRARELLPMGYARITGYECKERGYEWFGGDPGHEALTAYGLLQFHDMASVHPVDAGMVERTKQWLLSRRDGKGGYLRNDRALDSFGRAPQPVTDAYVTMALLESGTPAAELERELASVAARAVTTTDAYELALCTLALQRSGNGGAAAARQRLLAMQQTDGSLKGGTTSITSSGGDDLVVETTAWATLAFLGDPSAANAARRGSEFLDSKRQASGAFGATQATICALRALTAYAQQNRSMRAAGTVRVFVGDRKLAEKAFAAGQTEAVELSLWSMLPPGDHELRLELESEAGVELPWAVDLGYHSDLPADDDAAAVGIATRLTKATVDEGATVGLEVTVNNRRAEGQPMAIAIIGLPAGLELTTSVLDDRKRAGEFDLWELRGRELVLYWRSLAPSVERHVQLDCIARIPGRTTGPAARACLYYTPQQLRWASPLVVEVKPAK